MKKLWVLGAVALGLASGATLAGEMWHGYPYGQPSPELTIEQQRKLGLTEEQIQKIAELRRDLEKQRAKLEGDLKKAGEAVAAANAEMARVSQDIRDLSTGKLQKLYDAVLTDAQKKALERIHLVDQAKVWLRGYQSWLKLTDAQVDDISNLLVPVFEKYAKAEGEAAAARDRLRDLRCADKPDIAAIEKAEKEVAELTKANVGQQRHDELMDKMKAGLLPDQLEKIGQIRRH